MDNVINLRPGQMPVQGLLLHIHNAKQIIGDEAVDAILESVLQQSKIKKD